MWFRFVMTGLFQPPKLGADVHPVNHGLTPGQPKSKKLDLGSRANSSAEERRPYKAVVAGSNPASPTENLLILGAVVKSVITPACHAGGRGFESRPLRDLTPGR